MESFGGIYGVLTDVGVPKYMAIVVAALVLAAVFLLGRRLSRKAEDRKRAELCPNCDTRLALVDSKRFDVWFWRCAKCEKSLRLPAPTREAK